jgi:hypothetical protein
MNSMPSALAFLRSLRRAIGEYLTHYHDERDHRGIENQLFRAVALLALSGAHVQRCQQFGGILSFYFEAAT